MTDGATSQSRTSPDSDSRAETLSAVLGSPAVRLPASSDTSGGTIGTFNSGR